MPTESLFCPQNDKNTPIQTPPYFLAPKKVLKNTKKVCTQSAKKAKKVHPRVTPTFWPKAKKATKSYHPNGHKKHLKSACRSQVTVGHLVTPEWPPKKD